MTTINEVSQSLDPGAYIELYTLDASKIGGGVYRFTPNKEKDGSAVGFNGNTYLFVALESEGFEWNGDGNLPRPQISFSSLNQTIYSLVVSTEGLLGAIVLRTRTLDRFLTGHENGETPMAYPTDVYYITRLMSMDKQKMTFELACPLDLPNCQLPARICMRNCCGWIYRHWDSDTSQWVYEDTTNSCPYSGATMYTKTGVQTNDPTQDFCGRRLSDCVLRFGRSAILPYGGFPGIARTK